MEIVVDVGRPPTLWFLDDDSVQAEQDVTPSDLEVCLNTLLAGEKNFTVDNRIGISKTLHRISALRNRVDYVIGLTYRIGAFQQRGGGCFDLITSFCLGRHIPGVCVMIQDLIHE